MSASVHRLPGAPTEPPCFGPAPLHRGERTACPGCGVERKCENLWQPGRNVYEWEITSGPSAIRLCSWWFRFWWRCKERRSHYHQKCLYCEARWIVGFLEEVE